MAKKAKDTNATLYRTSVTLEEGQRYALDMIAPGNASEALRYLIRYAIQHGALEPYRPKPTQPVAPAVSLTAFAAWDTDDILDGEP
jgi:hypothetical protein